MRVGVDEDLLDRAAVWPVGEDDVGEFAVEGDETFGQRRFGVGFDLTVGMWLSLLPTLAITPQPVVPRPGSMPIIST